MTLGLPEGAPPRTDLPYLRHRRRPSAPAAAAPASRDLTPAPAPPRRLVPLRRTAPHGPLQLTAESPTAVLTRVQSGVGTMTVAARWSRPAIGRLIVAYQLDNGDQRLFTPPDGPLVTADCLLLDHRGSHAVLTIDLLHVRTLTRVLLAVVPVDPAGALTGALVSTTYGGARIDQPVSIPAPAGVAVLATIHNMDGELVLRAEWDAIGRSLQDACDAYGYDRVTWLDPATPLR